VIGADGRNSRIARLAGAKTYHDRPPVTFGYYTYWRGCPVAGMHAWLEPGRFFGIFPVGGGLTLAFVQGPRGDYQTFRRDPRTAYVSELRSRPALAGLPADAVIAEHLRGTAALPNWARIAAAAPGQCPSIPSWSRFSASTSRSHVHGTPVQRFVWATGTLRASKARPTDCVTTSSRSRDPR
jgi:hypothetical protein